MITKGLDPDIIRKGKNDSVVNRTNMGRTTIMSLVNPRNPKTTAQGGQRNIYFVTSADWNLLTESEKTMWKEKAKDTAIYPNDVPFVVARGGRELFKQVNNFYEYWQAFGLRIPPQMGYQEMEIKLDIRVTTESNSIDGKFTLSPDLEGYVFRVEMAIVEPDSGIVWYNQLFLLNYYSLPPDVWFYIEPDIKKKFGKRPKRNSVIYCKVYGINYNDFTRTNETITISIL